MTSESKSNEINNDLNPEELFNLGLRYEKGDRLVKSLVKAAEAYALAAEKGNLEAMFWLGNAYKVGRGVPIDLTLAVKWLYIAAANDMKKAAWQLCYLRKKLERNARLKDAEAMYHLAAMYYRGFGAKQDWGMAYALIMLALEYLPEGNQKNDAFVLYVALGQDMCDDLCTGEFKRAVKVKRKIEQEMQQGCPD